MPYEGIGGCKIGCDKCGRRHAFKRSRDAVERLREEREHSIGG
jgi:hypothetical protein